MLPMEFTQLYEQYWQKIFRLSMGYVNNQDWAKDITQETFITVWQQLPNFRNESSIGTWIFRIATNNCLRQIDKEKRLPKSTMQHDIAAPATMDTESSSTFLYQCIAELPETERLIISLELEDIKQAEIAQIVGISEANVRVKIHRIKEKLTLKFKKNEQFN
jgi:RNA polymerase sigma-70 factor, ECF subfamily